MTKLTDKLTLLRLIEIVVILAILVFGFVNQSQAAAGVPKILNHQGRLLNSSGDLLGGSSGTDYYFCFSIYDASSGGNKLWPSGTPSSVGAAKGR